MMARYCLPGAPSKLDERVLRLLGWGGEAGAAEVEVEVEGEEVMYVVSAIVTYGARDRKPVI
jgi:hypothetical protein